MMKLCIKYRDSEENMYDVYSDVSDFEILSPFLMIYSMFEGKRTTHGILIDDNFKSFFVEDGKPKYRAF